METELIDFSKFPQDEKASYEGANGGKICVLFNNERYMVKFPPIPTKTEEMSYTNSCISEYIGCHIFEFVGIEVQKTLLGKYKVKNGKEKIVVGCKDFTSPGIILRPFAALKNQNFDSSSNGYGTELSDILESFTKQHIFEINLLSERFWDMFIVDALIGNWDRHNGNWGYLHDQINNTVRLAPVYDCGSSLFPQLDENSLPKVLSDEQALKSRVYSFPTSSIKINDKRINYHDFITSLQNMDCNEAVKRIFPKIQMDKINTFIDGIPVISELQKIFYKTILKKRYDLILTPTYKKIMCVSHS